ncbi:zinc protease [Pontibacillus halophilus JSM 076056 = DSM 19796]|uniref:Zinc protease n=1 Tax=Pontibacillus halophilus JSM 076056 = DSM 19796 TaxID=1385510 RepID=A0A0A5GPN7_9BACI|nr:pitrilysin family protein [Pontibacillus halophilus]KGX93125.1 zinc protease [Pontibacillus halophilus JSM 076056 = DSM 19796]
MVKTYTCSNGLRIVMEEIPTVRSVTIGLWVLAGSRNETKENNGISHFIEHMFFKGTKKRSAKDIAEAFDSIGGQVNAFTSKEYTCYYAKVLDHHRDTALDVLSDMFFHSTFDPEEMEREKKVVLEEINMAEDTPDDIVHDLLAKATYGNHPLGYPILGTEETLRSFTKEHIQAYMEENYTPENIVISVAGNVSDAFISQIEQIFGSYTTGKKQSSLILPSFQGEHIARKKDTEQAHLTLGYNGVSLHHEDIFSLVVFNNVLGGSMSSRLFQEVREQRGLAYSVFSYHSSHIDSGLLTIYGGTGKNYLTELKDTIEETVQQLVRNGLSDKELTNSKEQLKGNILLSLESTNSRMSRNGKNELLLRRHRSLDELIEQIDGVNHTTIDRIVKDVFTNEPASALISPENT